MTSIAAPVPQAKSVALKPIRVLHVLEATLGGTLRYLENVAAATVGTQIVSSIAYGTARADSRLTPFLERTQAAGWSVFPVDMRREIEPRNDFAALIGLWRVMNRLRPHIVHCHSSKAGALGRAAASLRLHGPTRLYTPHALPAPLGAKYLKIEKLLARFTDGFVAVSDSEQAEIVGFDLMKPRFVHVVYPSIDAEFFAPAPRDLARRALGLGTAPLILGIGRLTAQKDPASFISIVQNLYRVRPDVRAIWVGSGEGEAEFRLQRAVAQLDDVIDIVSWQHDVRPYIAAADVLLSTSMFESFGYMVAEALAMGIPAVATDITGTCDIMRGELRDWLYPAGDHTRAAQLLTTLLDDPIKASAVGQRGRFEVQQRFSAERMRDALLETYTTALANSGRRGGDSF